MLRCKHLVKTPAGVKEIYEPIIYSHDGISSLMNRYGHTEEEVADKFDKENIEFGVIAASNLATEEPVMVLVVLRDELLLFDLTISTSINSEYIQNCCTELISLEAFALLHKYVRNNSQALLETVVGQQPCHNRLIEFGSLVKECYSLTQSDTQDNPVYTQQLSMIESFMCRNITKSARN